MLTQEERQLLFVYCADHPVTCCADSRAEIIRAEAEAARGASVRLRQQRQGVGK